MKHIVEKIALALFFVAVLLFSATACGGKTYTVTFAGEGVNLPAQSVAASECATEPQPPEKEGYIFLGWYEEGKDEPYHFSLPVAKDLTLTARFEKNISYSVTFAGEGVNLPAQTVALGGKANKPSSPVRAGYVFLGWYLEGADVAFDFDTVITSDITLHARYKTLDIEDATPAHPFL